MNNSFNIEASFSDIPLRPQEWSECVFISGIKVRRVTTKCLKDLLLYDSIVESKEKILLLSDLKNAIVLKLNKNGKVIKRSFLNYKQDENVCEFACHLKIENLTYTIGKDKLKYIKFIDEETKIRNYIIDSIIKSNDENKDKYVYYLAFNRINDYSKDKLLEFIKISDDEKCQKIYNFLIEN